MKRSIFHPKNVPESKKTWKNAEKRLKKVKKG